MLLPASSHREYFRQRANPRFNPGVKYVFKERSACSKGSRWHRYAFSFADVGTTFRVSSGRILVNGSPRSEIDVEFSKNGLDAPAQCTDAPLDRLQNQGITCDQNAKQMEWHCKYDSAWIKGTLCQQSCFDAGVRYGGDDCSAGWSALDGTSGFVCFVEEAVGGLVAWSTNRHCPKDSRRFMENPAIWFSDKSKATSTGLPFDASVAKAGLVFLSEDSPSCSLGDKEFIRNEGLFYRYDARVELEDNTCKLWGGQGALDGDPGLCGSPGEVSNQPTEGHQLAFWAADTHEEVEDTRYDNRYGTGPEGAASPKRVRWLTPLHDGLVRGAVWLARALGGEDQLRQRMAWALSQIFVVGSSGTMHERWNELWVAYYDIFVRNAFGSFRSLLREVTFSPLMGDYLTYVHSESFDASGSYPDENYAREIMQLFTIGLSKLTPDGRVQVDEQGVDVPAYDNDNVMSFARVFTGFVPAHSRGNIELRNGRNVIDPLRLRAGGHDFFPKQDLHGGYLGDGLPWCSELPARPFLLPGARFEFRGSSVPDCASHDTAYEPRDMPFQDRAARPSHRRKARSSHRRKAIAGPPDCEALAFEPGPGSELLRALCGGDASNCSPAPSRTLTSALACHGAECSLDDASIFKAAGGYFEFAPPACVHPFFSEGIDSAVPVQVQVHEDGAVSAHTEDHEHNRFLVSWIGPARAPAGSYGATVETAAVFDTAPSSADVLATLRVAAAGPPSGAECAQPCGGDVRVWGASPPDVDTVFEVGGHFYRNVQSVVSVGPASFRNPPVFVTPGPLRQTGRALERAVRAEIDSLLDHLFRHPNTPVFISKKLIQRFVTSNPSPSYVESVVRAFSTGSYDGVTYAGEYGDLGATIAAILLHPEARSSDSSAAGLLREPMLKLVHLMRSMDYADVAGQEVVLQNLGEVIGQFPYSSPSVFNFFEATYQPPRFAGAAAARGPEPGPVPGALVAPEFQIFTPPFALGFLNGVASLLDNGASKCEGGFGSAGGGMECRQGGLNFSSATPDAEGVVRELDTLLTGGRLTPASRELVLVAYQEHGLKGAQQAVVLTPEFHTLGVPRHSGEVPKEERPPPSSARSSYRAVVMLFLQGGADTYNLVVPTGCSLYEEYAAVRASMAIAQDSLLPVTASSEQPCDQFGIHPALPFLRELYEEKKQAAFVSSVGALVEPVTRSTFRSSAKTCLGLFSHSDQQSAAHTLKCQDPGAAPKGAGGRMADVLAASHGKAVASFSVSGVATWSGGFNTTADILDKAGGAIRFNKYPVWNSTIGDIAKQKYGNLYCEEYTRAFGDHIRSSEALGNILEDVALETDATYEAKTGLAQQLHQVARLIKARSIRLAERDFFFVQLGGFDTHKGQVEVLSGNFAELDGALRDFVGELTQQGVFDDVVVVTHSDFGRTLTSNGAGTDHGWGGNHVVIGGGIHGGQIFNRFLQTYKAESTYDAGRGRVIPQYPWESVMVPIAEWMGVEELEAVFPNLPNFNRSTHIISHGSLFKS